MGLSRAAEVRRIHWWHGRRGREAPHDKAMEFQDCSLGLHTFRQIRMNVIRKKLGGIRLRFPDLKDLPPIADRCRSMRDEPLRLLEDGTQGGNHAVIPFQRLTRNVCGHKYSHIFSSPCRDDTRSSPT